MVFLLPLIGVVGPFGDQGLDGEYVPGRARLSFTTALLPGALFPSVSFTLEGRGSFVGLGRFPVEASCTDWGV